MEALNAWLGHWEPLWLFILIGFEALIGVPINIATLYILILEFKYDKDFNEAMKASRRERRRKKYEFEQLTEGESK